VTKDQALVPFVDRSKKSIIDFKIKDIFSEILAARFTWLNKFIA